MSDSLQREQTIFDAVLELPTAERVAYLDREIHGDGALRERLNELLKSYEVGTFLENSAAAVSRRTIAGSEPPVEPGEKIGRYKLLQSIGEGGCGVVYMAEQEEPVRRRVALKIIKLGMDTKSVIARFEAERQALAMMDHPNIAKVLDAGATETGRPYFVMELVRGMKITDYCDEAKLSIRERLGLFIQVCQAIQHAHQKGIIHRDLKPSNILVTINDGVAVPKVIDFGIAKAIGGQRLTDKTIFTAFEQFIGTPAYMSPEQVVLTSLDIDTRSDIYALGVLLYELLSGTMPFETKDLLATGLDEMRRTIREKEPDRPSTRLSTMAQAELSTTAQRRGIDAPKLLSGLRGDLDWIVMKCLEKDRARRYETANGLATDIQRHLNNDPVVARPPSNLYRVQKLIGRNQLAFTLGVVVTAALAIGSVVSSWMFLQEREARKRAVAAGQAELKWRRELDLRDKDEYASQVQMDRSLAEAETTRRTALEFQRLLLGAENPDVAESLERLAKILSDENNYSEAEEVLREAVEIRRKNAGQGDTATAGTLEQLGGLHSSEGKNTEAEARYREALLIRRRAQGEQSTEVADTLKVLANSLVAQSRRPEALPLCLERLAILRKVLGNEDPRTWSAAHDTIRTMIDLEQFSDAASMVRDAWPANLGASLSELLNDLYGSRKDGEAEKLLNDLIAKTPDSARLLAVHAEFSARAGHFDIASADFRRLIEINPQDEALWHAAAAILAYTGRIQEHAEHCRKFLERFAKSKDVFVLERAAKNALLLPEPDGNLESALKAVDAIDLTALRSGKPWLEFVKGLAEYRRGHFEQAIDVLQHVPMHPRASAACEALAYPVLAMANYRLHDVKQGKRALAQGAVLENEARAKLEDGYLGGDWTDWLRVFLLMREARSLMADHPDTTAGTR